MDIPAKTETPIPPNRSKIKVETSQHAEAVPKHKKHAETGASRSERFRLYFRRAMAATALAVAIAAFAFALGHKFIAIDTLFRFKPLVYTELTKAGID
jgi:hypothetical protein